MFAALSDMFSGGKNLPRWSRTAASGRVHIIDDVCQRCGACEHKRPCLWIPASGPVPLPTVITWRCQLPPVRVPLDYATVTFAACSPFGPSITSNSTCAPSDRERKPRA